MAVVARKLIPHRASLALARLWALAALSACTSDSPLDEEPPLCADMPDGELCGAQRVCRAGACVPVRPDQDASLTDGGAETDASHAAIDGSLDAPGETDPDASVAHASDAEPATRCGDGIVQHDAGEVCDGPSVTPQGQRLACASDCSMQLPEDECSKCQARACTAYEGVDLVAGCFTKIDPQFAADPADTTFLAECSEAFNCAFAAGCAFGAMNDPLECYCGSAMVGGDCQTSPAADAACGDQWRRAARAMDPATAYGNMSDLALPIGWAIELFDCLRERCSDVCRSVR